MLRFLLIPAVTLAVALTGVGMASGEGPSAATVLEDAQRLITVELRFREGTEVLERVLGDPRITRAERIESYRLLGIAFVAIDAKDSADAAFTALLEIEPSFELDPLLSPKIQRVFERVRARLAATPRITDVTAMPEDERILFSGRIADASSRVDVVDLFTRIEGSEVEQQRMERNGDRLTASIDPERSRSKERSSADSATWVRIEYYIVGRSLEGVAIVEVADAENPSSVVVGRTIATPASRAASSPPPFSTTAAVASAPAERSAWYSEWWIWVIALGLVATSATTFLVLSRGGDGALSGTLDPIELE